MFLILSHSHISGCYHERKKKRFILTCGYSAQRKVRGHVFRSGLQKSCSVPVCRVMQVKAPSLHHLAVKDALRNMENSHVCVCVCVRHLCKDLSEFLHLVVTAVQKG